MSVTHTLAPARPNARAIPQPKPRPAPVTNATLPVRGITPPAPGLPARTCRDDEPAARHASPDDRGLRILRRREQSTPNGEETLRMERRTFGRTGFAVSAVGF